MATLSDLSKQIRDLITHEVNMGTVVGMYESKTRVIFTLEADGEIHVIAEVKRPSQWGA